MIWIVVSSLPFCVGHHAAIQSKYNGEVTLIYLLQLLDWAVWECVWMN